MTEEKDGKLGENLATVAQAVGIISLVGGVLLTSALYFAASRFYAELGVEPSEVGIQVPELIPQSLVGLVYLGLVAVAVLVPLALIGTYVIRRTFEPTTKRGVVVISLVWGAGWIWLQYAVDLWWVPPIVALVAVALLWWKRDVQLPRWTVASVSAALFGALISVLYVVMVYEPRVDADAVRSGRSVANRPFLPWEADVARVVSVETGRELLPCALYLGSANGLIVAYVPDRGRGGRVERLPAGRVKVLAFHDEPSCRALAADHLKP